MALDTATTLADRVAALNRLAQNFDYEAAHDEFYHEDLVTHENEDAPTVGLTKHREAMRHYLASIGNATAEPLHTIVSDNMSATEWRYRFEHMQWGPKDFRQLSVQRWRDGKVIHERHYYRAG